MTTREQRYGKVIWETSRADEGTISVTGANIVARAVMAVADQEQAELRRWHKRVIKMIQGSRNRWKARAEKAEEALAAEEAHHQITLDDFDRLRNEIEDHRRRTKDAEATTARVGALVRKDHTPEEAIHEDYGGQDLVHYCGGCGTDLDEDECPYLAALRGPEPTED